jgi:aminocarboxymuconate-semialdehyde decarboxylase
VSMSASLVDSQQAVEYSRLYNRELTALAELHASRFRALATLPTQSASTAAQELRTCMNELGMVGAQLPAMFPGDPANEWVELWAAAEELGAILLIHPVSLPLAEAPYVLGAMVGNPAETTYEMARLILTGTLERHPRLKLVVVHGGGFLPYQAGRIEHAFNAYGENLGAPLKTSPLAQIKLLHYDSLLHSPLMTAALIELVGANRVVIGSDHPFLLGDRDPVASADQIPNLTQEDLSMIRSGNLLRLMDETSE